MLRNLKRLLAPMATDNDNGESDAIDDLIRSAGIRRRPVVATSDADSDPLNDLVSGSRLMNSAEPSDNALQVKKWTRAIGVAVAALAMAGLLADSVAASQLLADSGPRALVVVWPLGGFGMLAVAALLMKYVDRFARLSILVVLCVGYAVAFVVALVLFATPLPRSVPAGLVWLLTDQLMFLLPLVIWSLAGDVFTAGQATNVFPRISRWMYIGHLVGPAVAISSPWWLEPLDLDLTWILVIPPIACVAVAVFLPRALRGSSASAGHGKSMSIVAALRDTTGLIKDLPAFSWMFKASLVIMLAGALLEFSSFNVLTQRFTSAGSLQSLYAGATLTIFVASWLIQRYVTPKVLNQRGVSIGLVVLPIATTAGAVVLVIGGALANVVVSLIGLLLWRVVRWSLDASARQTAMATLPDGQRTRASFLIDLLPLALGFIFFAPLAVIGLSLDLLWFVPVIALLFSTLGIVASRHIVDTWDTTQLSYRLKRRRRMG